MLKKVIRNQWLSPFVRILANIEWVISWPISHPSNKFVGKPFSSFCVNQPTNQQTNGQS